MSPATIILLNGASSAGKSSIARELQDTLTEPFLHVGVDYFLRTLPRRYFGVDPAPGTPAHAGVRWVTRTDQPELCIDISVGPVGEHVLAAARQAVVAMARTGVNLILDEVLLSPELLLGYLQTLINLDVLFVGVRCPLAVLEQREQQRHDRYIGQARGHHEAVHAYPIYDVEVDTSTTSPSDCARAVIQRLEQRPPYTAFSRLRLTSSGRSSTAMSSKR